MGLNINIYTKDLSLDLLSRIKHRFKDFGMVIEFHPEFKLDEQNDSGFCPIKLKLEKGKSEHYDKFKNDVLTGFEIYFDDYNYVEELKEIEKPIKEDRTFFSKLFGSKKNSPIENSLIVNKNVDEKLSHCNKNLILNWQSKNKSELRISLFFGAILTELTGGILYDPQNAQYFSGKDALELFPTEIAEYENSFDFDNFTLTKFENW